MTTNLSPQKFRRAVAAWTILILLFLSVVVLEVRAGWTVEEIVHSLVVAGLVLFLAWRRMRSRSSAQDPLWIVVLFRLLRGTEASSPSVGLATAAGGRQRTDGFLEDANPENVYTFEQGTAETPAGPVEWKRWTVFGRRRG